MTPKQKCKDIRDRFYPVDERPSEILLSRVLKLGGADKDLVEVGCGRVPHFLRYTTSSYRFVYGVDPEVAEPFQEGNLRVAKGFAETLDLPDESVDVLVSTDVVEHLSDPRKALAESMRVLRPGGKILVITPNKNHPPLFAARLLSHGLRQKINGFVTGTKDEDTFPTFYRLNSVPDVKRLAHEMGLKVVAAEYLSNHPQYLMFSRVCYRVGITLERGLLNKRPLAFLRQYIFAELEKPKSVEANAKKQPVQVGKSSATVS
jgi:ubiquinone/menaquinone biosynthesis C-methylase UbiE